MIACLLLVRTRVRVSTQHFGPDWQHTGPWRGGFSHRCVHVVARVSAEQLRGQRGGPFGVLDVAGALLMVMVSSLNLALGMALSRVGGKGRIACLLALQHGVPCTVVDPARKPCICVYMLRLCVCMLSCACNKLFHFNCVYAIVPGSRAAE